jgi:hypothetical protein
MRSDFPALIISGLNAGLDGPYRRNIPAIETRIVVQVHESAFLCTGLSNRIQEIFNVLFMCTSTRCKLPDIVNRQRIQLEHPLY